MGRRDVKFCAEPSLTPVPVSEPVVSSFVAFLALEGLKHRTITVHLLAVKQLQIEFGLPSVPHAKVGVRDKRGEA